MAKRRRKTKALGAIPLPRHMIGAKKCIDWRGQDDRPVKLCVEGKRYGFTGTLLPRSGRGPGLPVPTGNARTMSEAIKNAVRFLDNHATRRN